jgi:2-dehydropantoate 2-reductase
MLVWGGGAIGGTVAAFLARAGTPVTLVDVNRNHIEAIERDGLRVASPMGDLQVRVPVLTPDQVTGLFDIVFLAVKADRTRVAADQAKPFLAPDGCIVSLQNGLCEVEIAQSVGAERTVGAFINFGADYVAPGRLLFANRGAVVVGEIDGRVRPRTGHIAQLLQRFEPDAQITTNIWGYLWGKTAYGALLKAEALSTQTMADFIGDPALQSLHRSMVRELLAVARSQGVTPLGFNGFEPSAFDGDDATASANLMEVADFWRRSPKTHSVPWRDIAVLRQKTDAAAQLIPVFAIAEKHGLTVPVSRKLVELIGLLEEGRAVQGPALVAELSQAAA